MTRLEVSTDETMEQLIEILRRKNLIATEETADQSTIFSSNANQIFTPNTISILFITVTEQNISFRVNLSRRKLQGDTVLIASNTTGNDTRFMLNLTLSSV